MASFLRTLLQFWFFVLLMFKDQLVVFLVFLIAISATLLKSLSIIFQTASLASFVR
jgi:hypothetical protein